MKALCQLCGPDLEVAFQRPCCDHVVEQDDQFRGAQSSHIGFKGLKLMVPDVPMGNHCVRVPAHRQNNPGRVVCCRPQRFQILQKFFGVGTDRLERSQLVQSQGIEPFAPIVLYGTQAKLVAVFHPTLLEQAGAVECVALEHATAPAVNGEDGRVVHPLCGHVQPVSTLRPLLDRELCAQVAQEVICCRSVRLPVRNQLFEEACCLRQAFANTPTQFRRRRIGKRHDQNLRRIERSRFLRTASPMPQNQTNVECRQRPGLARSGGGFDDA